MGTSAVPPSGQPGTLSDVTMSLARSNFRGWDRVEKLEKILHAEDAARAEAENARATSTSMLSEARAKAAELLRAGREDLRDAVAARREAVLEQARADAATIASEAEVEATTQMDAAEGRADDATKAVLDALRGI